MERSAPYARYVQHQASAKTRGIGFNLTFEQWWDLWEPHWEKRGRGSFDMCMCRRHDQGSYELGNVRIATNRENKHEAAMELKVRRSQRPYRPKIHKKIVITTDQVGWLMNHDAFEEYSEETS